MKKLLLIALIIFLQCNIIYSQGEFHHWYFGVHAGISFNSNPPIPLTNLNFTAQMNSSSISDSNGTFLFFCNGASVFDRTFNMMPNGSNLAGNSIACQPVFTVQSLTDDSLYYLFTVDDYSWPYILSHSGLKYSILNMRLNNGLGDLETTNKNIPIGSAYYASQALYACRHKNNKDVWVVVRKSDPSNQFASYKIDQAGLDTVPVYSTSIVPYASTNNMDKISRIKISPDGSKLAAAYSNIVEICNFNSSTGQIQPLFVFSPHQGYPPDGVHSIEFSPDGKYLYVARLDMVVYNGIYQYDATKTDSISFVQTEVFLGYNYSGHITFQRAPDYKIYFSEQNLDSLGVINYPNLQGTACDLQVSSFYLDNNINLYGLPDFLDRYYVHIHHGKTCLGDSVQFTSTIWTPADSVIWNFGDPASGGNNISYLSNPNHYFSAPGNYTVKLYVRHIDNRTDTSWKTITIHEVPDPDLGPNQTICQGDSITLDAGACTGCSYEWSSIPPGFTFTEQTVILSQSGIYIVAVTSTSGCVGHDTIQLTVTAPPIITNSPLFKSICSGEATDIPLTSNLPGTSFSWTATSSSPSVTGYGPGTGDTIDQVLTNTGTNPETVTYTITPSLGDCEGDSVEYVVTLIPGDSVLVNITASNDSICEGIPVTYTATSEHGGSAPNYQWMVNGINQGLNNAVFSYSPSDSDTVYCILTSSDIVCISNNPATSNELIMTVYPDLPISISISTTNNPICEGSIATFTVSTINKGTLPVFQWFVNANPVGTNDSTYAYTPSNSDQVTCMLTSSEQCTTNNPATSNPITMIVNPLLPVNISISPSANPVCGGSPVTLTATPINGGSSPGFQWQVNGVNVGNTPNYTYLPDNGDVLTCILTSNEICITGNPATSNSIIMSVGQQPDVSFTACFDTITTLNAKPFKLKSGIPLGGTYSGPGVNQITGYFNPAMAGVGLKTISYSYTNLFNCSNNATRVISVVNPAPFSCGDSLTDIRDNKKYPTIQIGSQCWLAANLNYGVQISGSQSQRDNCIPEKYCYNDIPELCALSSALYQWDELMQYEDAEEIQGLCPPGWHVPSESDWNQLFAVYQGNAFAGSPLLYTGYSSFNVLLAGVEFFNQSNRFADFASIMWSSTSHGPYKAWSHGLNEYNYSVSYYPSYRANAFSVRCVRE